MEKKSKKVAPKDVLGDKAMAIDSMPKEERMRKIEEFLKRDLITAIQCMTMVYKEPNMISKMAEEFHEMYQLSKNEIAQEDGQTT